MFEIKVGITDYLKDINKGRGVVTLNKIKNNESFSIVEVFELGRDLQYMLDMQAECSNTGVSEDTILELICAIENELFFKV